MNHGSQQDHPGRSCDNLLCKQLLQPAFLQVSEQFRLSIPVTFSAISSQVKAKQVKTRGKRVTSQRWMIIHHRPLHKRRSNAVTGCWR
jgi:hypothetical protein